MEEERQKLIDLLDSAKRASLRPILEKVQNNQSLAPHELKLLNEFESQLKAEPPEVLGDQEFKNLLEVSTYLDREGWKLSRSTLYKHSKEGRLKPDHEGGYSLKAVRKYAASFLMRKSDRQKMADEELQRKKTKAEIQLRQEQARLAQFKRMIEEGKYIEKDQLYLELASRAAVLDTGIKAVVQVRAEEWVAACTGDHGKIAEFTRSVLADMEDLVNNFSTTRQFHVVCKGEEAEGRRLKAETRSQEGE